AHGAPHKESKNVPRPHHQQKVEDEECARPLFPQLHQASQRNCEIDKVNCRHHGSREGLPQTCPPHSNCPKKKRSQGGEKSCFTCENRGIQQRILVAGYGDQSKEQSEVCVGRYVRGAKLVC